MEAELDAMIEVGAEEVRRAVARSETQLLRRVEGLAPRADLLSMYQMVFGDADRLNGEVERLRRVTPEQVGALAAARLGPDNRAVLTYVPRSAG